jgi:hypothetical protein
MVNFSQNILTTGEQCSIRCVPPVLITDNTFSYERNSDKIEAEAKLDGMYVIRTSVSQSVLDDSKTVKTYKSLSQV